MPAPPALSDPVQATVIGIAVPVSGVLVRMATLGVPAVGATLSTSTVAPSTSAAGPVLPAVSVTAPDASPGTAVPSEQPPRTTLADAAAGVNPVTAQPVAVPPTTTSAAARPVTGSLVLIVNATLPVRDASAAGVTVAVGATVSRTIVSSAVPGAASTLPTT